MHTLEGKLMNETVYLISDFKGLVPFTAVNSCSVPVAARYTCDICEGTYFVNVVKEHTFYDDLDTSNDVKPTCTEDGYKLGYCKDCGRGVEVKKTVEANGHSYDYLYVVSKKQLVAVCSVNGCDEIFITDGVTRTVTPSTCIKEGLIVYTYTDEKGDEKVIKDVIAKKSHTAAVEIGENGAYAIDDRFITLRGDVIRDCTAGIIENGGYFICTNPNCKAEVLCDVYQPHIADDEQYYVISVDPTCTTAGTKVLYCKYCPTGENVQNEQLETEALPPLGHSFIFEVTKAPTATEQGLAIGTCYICATTRIEGEGEEAVEVTEYVKVDQVLPAVNAENYNDSNTVITHITLPTCLTGGIDSYSYTFEYHSDITDEDIAYTVVFDVASPKYEYVEGESKEFTIENNEEVTFLDPFGNETTATLTVTYRFYECTNESCDVHIILSKTFSYNDNDYTYNFDTAEYDLVITDEEKQTNEKLETVLPEDNSEATEEN